MSKQTITGIDGVLFRNEDFGQFAWYMTTRAINELAQMTPIQCEVNRNKMKMLCYPEGQQSM